MTAIPRGSFEYVTTTVTVTSPPAAQLDTQPVAIALTHPGDDHTWLPAEWVGDPGTTRQARTTDPIDFADAAYDAHSDYGVYVQIIDNTETPILAAGRITLT